MDFVEIAADSLSTNKASECKKHLLRCEAASAAGVCPEPVKRKRTAEAASDAVLRVELEEERAKGTALVASETRLAAHNDELAGRMPRLSRFEVGKVGFGRSDPEFRNVRRNSNIRATQPLRGNPNLPLPHYGCRPIMPIHGGKGKAALVARCNSLGLLHHRKRTSVRIARNSRNSGAWLELRLDARGLVGKV